MEHIKKVLKGHSPYLIFLAIAESIISIVCTLAFVYADTLSYQDSVVFEAIGLEKLLESIYSSTWWALILLTLAFIAIFTITGIVYKRLEYNFISMLLWGEMLILAIDIGKPSADFLSVLALFIPIIIINIIAYNDEKKRLNKPTKKHPK